MSTEYIQKKELERKLSKIRSFSSPQVTLEQYVTPEHIAAEILWFAAYTYKDIIQKIILDLGCGAGILGIGATLLGAQRVIGVDIDPRAIRTAITNSELLGIKEKIDWIAMEVGSVTGRYDTVIENPPFGTKRRGADLRFLQKALEVGEVVYSLHKSGLQNRATVRDFVDKNDAKITVVLQNKFALRRTLNFHRKREYTFDVDLYRIVRR